MNRSYSYSAQIAFDLMNRLQSLSTDSSRFIRLSARIASRLAQPFFRRLLAHRIVKSRVYGQTLLMPSEHPLPMTLKAFPRCNRPLGLSVEAISAVHAGNSPITIIDVGANIGDTVAIIEQHTPGACSYLCIEADENIAEICRLNHEGNHRVEVKQCFIGEDEGAPVRLEDDGRANPSTKLVTEPRAGNQTSVDRLVRLDTVARSFAEAHGRLSLIKVDTEGYDFSVLRSGSGLLSQYRPELYFEWFPRLLTALNEEIWGGFEFLKKIGYRHFVFFTSQGDFYCEISEPDQFFLCNLARVTEREGAFEYFDVFASTSEQVCNELTERSFV